MRNVTSKAKDAPVKEPTKKVAKDEPQAEAAPDNRVEFEASAMGRRHEPEHRPLHMRRAPGGANPFPTVLPCDKEMVIGQIKGGPLAILQYRETDEQRRRNTDPEATGLPLAGDFYGSHAGSADYTAIIGPVIAWAPLPDMKLVEPDVRRAA